MQLFEDDSVADLAACQDVQIGRVRQGLARLVETPRANVTYYHLVMDRHELVNADGVWTETVFAGPEGLAADPVLSEMLDGRDIPQMDRRARPLLLRKHLRRYSGLSIGLTARDGVAAA